jgi:hypothetical protein
VGEAFVSCQLKVPGNQKQAVAWAALLSAFPLIFLTRFCLSLSRLSFSLFNLSQFDEPTPPEVSMTESHTPPSVQKNEWHPNSNPILAKR